MPLPRRDLNTEPTTPVIPQTIPIQDESDVVKARQLVRTSALALKFSLIEQTKLITAASELARNTLIHGGGGEMTLEQVEEDGKPGLRLVFEDEGPGIPDVKLAMSDGYTTGGGMGLGLPGSKRLAAHFEITSTLGQGTCVTIIALRGR